MSKPIVVVGSINVDLVVNAMRLPVAGETLPGSAFRIFTGGKGANQAIAASRLGAKVYLIAKVGDDPFSSGLLQELRAAGIATEAVGSVQGPSGVAVIVTTQDGQNSILVVPGANHELTPVALSQHAGLIAQAGMVLTQLETPMETLEMLASMTDSLHVPLMLDPAPARELPPEILRKVAWLTPNETEARTLAAAAGEQFPATSLNRIAEYFLGLGPANVLLKLGQQGVFVATRQGLRLKVPAYAVPVVDTTAAGDAFNGAFAVALTRGMDPAAAARFATQAAAISVTRQGAAPSMPTQAEVDAFFDLLPAKPHP